MSSVLRSYAQIPATVKYFIYGNDAVAGDMPTGSATILAAGDYAEIGSMISLADFTALTTVIQTPSDLAPGALLKDMGRQITFYDGTVAGKPHVAVYREVQRVNGSDSEGVGGAAGVWGSTYFVKVWSADGTGVNVFRTG
jgi:hypothetical protein